MGAEVALVGVNTIKLGACGTNGTMGTTLTAIGIVVPDSVLLTIEPPEKIDIFVEDFPQPFFSIPDPNLVQNFEFSVRDVTPATLVKALGGTTATTKWTQAVAVAIIEQSVETTSKTTGGKYYKVSIPRANIRGSLDGKFVGKDTATLKFTCNILQPVNASNAALPAITIEQL